MDQKDRNPKITREAENTNHVELKNLSGEQLLQSCADAHGTIQKRCWADAGPFFEELFRRIEEHRIPGVRTKSAACAIIGCSLRWAQAIVAGTARNPNSRKNQKFSSPESAPAPIELVTAEDIASEIAEYAFRKLKALSLRDWPQYRVICQMLAEHFRKEAEAEDASQ